MNDSEARFVTLLYEGVLRRAPDQKGHADNTAALGPAPDFQAALALLEAFVGSSESKNLLAAPRDCIGFHGGTGVRSVVSIGSHCLSSFTLKKKQLKRGSGPFDWIFSSLGMVADCIEDEFADFMNPKYFQPIPWDHRRHKDANFCDHTLYRARYGISSIHNHSDPTEATVYAYLERCVRRFKTTLRANYRNILFGICAHDRATTEDFHRLCDRLNTHGQSEAWIIWLVPSTPRAYEQEFRLEEIRGRHRLYRMRATSAMGPVSFEGSLDNVVVDRFLDGFRWNLDSPEADQDSEP